MTLGLAMTFQIQHQRHDQRKEELISWTWISRSEKDIIKRLRRQGIDWKKVFAKDISDKELYPKYTKNS